MSIKGRAQVARGLQQVIRRWAAAVAVVGLLAMGGCAPASEQPSAQLVDETGAVQEYRFLLSKDVALSISIDEIEAHGTGAILADPPSGWDLRVAWAAATCWTAPTVTVTGSAGRIAGVSVRYGPEVGPGECPDSWIIYGVDLRVSGQVADDVSVSGSAG